MQLETIQNIAMIPVQGTVYIVKLPFVCIWRVVFFLYFCLYAVFISVLSFPVYYVKKGYNRIMVTWTWTKLSLKQSLGFSSKLPALTNGTQTLHPRDYLSDPVSGHPSQLSVQSDEDSFLATHYDVYRKPGSRKRSRHERKAMITHLLRLLLEPSSPVESDDESERTSTARSAGPEQDEAEKALNLILDLVKLSKSGVHEPVGGGKESAASLKPGHLESLLHQAKDRQQLQALIAELDQLAFEVDPVNLLRKSGQGPSNHLSPSHALVDPDRPSSSNSTELMYTPNPGSIVSSSDEGVDPNDNDDQFHDVEVHPTSCERPVYKHGTLSPVQESPEYLTASAESLKLNQLEDELTKALSNLSTATSGLNADQEMVESMETEITQKTVTVTETNVRDSDLESVPKTTPLLGVQVGHQKRDLANARKPRPPSKRPGHAQNQDSPSDKGTEGDLALESSESDGEEPHELVKGKKKCIGGVHTPLSLLLTDQIQLLSSGSHAETRPIDVDDDETEEVPLLDQSDGLKGLHSHPGNTVKKTDNSQQDSSSSDIGVMKIKSSEPLWIEMRRKRTSSSSSSATTPTGSSSTVLVYTPPPRKNRAQSDPQPEVADLLQQKDAKKKETSIWDTDPGLDNRDSLYDTLKPKSEGTVKITPTQPLYLHERIALKNGASSVEPSPRLPPRNSLALKRAASDETVSRFQMERPIQRRGSEKQSSHKRNEEPVEKSKQRRERSRDSSKEHRERSKEHSERLRGKEKSRDKESHGSSSNRSKDKESKEVSTRESRSRDKEARQSRSRGKEKHGHHSHSSERSSSRSEHKHSSDHHHRSRSGDRSSSHSIERHSSSHRHHRSRSGDRSSSHSTERHSSSHRHSSSDRHRSHSSHKSSSAAASSPELKSIKESEAKLASSSSKSIFAGLFSRSSAKDSSSKSKDEKPKKASSSDREKKLKSTGSKSRSSSFRSSDKTSARRAGSSSSPEKEEYSVAGKVVSSASMSSLRSADTSSVYSFDSTVSSKNN